jgi:hypothetical protein
VPPDTGGTALHTCVTEWISVEPMKLQLPATYHSGKTVIIGFDTEFVPGREKNDIVSYQAFVISASGCYEWFKLLAPGERMTLADLLREVLAKGLDDGCLKVWPTEVHFAIHWSLADLTALENFDELKASFDGIRKTYATVFQPLAVEFWDRNRNKRKLELRLFDTTMLAPDNARKLQNLGALIGVEKVGLPDGAISDMRSYSAEDPENFRRYGMVDAEIAAKWLVFVGNLSRDLIDADSPPISLGSIATKLTLKLWKENGIDRLLVLGKEKAKGRGGKPYERLIEERDAFERHACEAFHGGRNETYFFGPTEEDEWTDWDLAGAYVTAISMMGSPDWKAIRKPKSLHEFSADVYGAASLQFSFPRSVLFPCLPVRAENALIFPLQGYSMATAPEIRLALGLGARMRILHDIGYIMPMEEHRPFELLSLEVTRCRADLKAKGLKGSAHELMIKTIGNSVYGKVSQGLREKRVFQTRTATMEKIPPSAITNPFMAAQVTGLVRGVLGEIINAIPPHYKVLSATTDGFITNAPDEVVAAATSGPLCHVFLQARKRLDPHCTFPLERKHRAHELFPFRTRGIFTLKKGTSRPEEEGVGVTILAKAGISVPDDRRGDENEYIIEKMINRHPDEPKDATARFRGPREIYKSNGRLDLTRKIVWIATRMDYDWKRWRSPQKGAVGTRPVRGKDHLFFDTVPLPSLEAYQLLLEEWQRFHKGRKVFLKTREVLAEFEDYLSVVSGSGVSRSRDGRTGVRTLVKMFLRAYVRNDLGLKRIHGNLAMVRLMGGFGFEGIKVSDIENVARPKCPVIYGCLRPNGPILDALKRLRLICPSFDPAPLFATSKDPLAYDEELHAELEGGDPRQLYLRFVKRASGE